MSDFHDQSQAQSSPPAEHSRLLSLPRELRDIILLYTILNDLSNFSLSARRPAFLFVCHQIQDEYTNVLFKTPGLLELETYKGSTYSWHDVEDLQNRRAIFLHSRFAFPMVASSNSPLGVLEYTGRTRRACRELWLDKGKAVRMGMMKLCTAKAGVIRWQWSMASGTGGECLGSF